MTCYFMFSQGSYSDYSIGGLYTCDHTVTEVEWDEHYKAYQEWCNEIDKKGMLDWATKTGVNVTTTINHSTGKEYIHIEPFAGRMKWFSSAEQAAISNLKRDNAPEKTFKEKHGMIAVECTEMWRD